MKKDENPGAPRFIVFAILALFILVKVLSSPMGQNMLK